MKLSLFIIGILIVIIFSILYKIKEPCIDIDIDAVISYVNDQDEYWIQQKEKYNKTANETINSRKKWRFQSSNEIKYCLLCIQKNCNFFRNIFIVIASHSQKFDTSFLSYETKNKIKFITHNEFYYNVNHLPTFNSISIEHNIHNIPNLSEHFVYFNDDCFICKPLNKYDFITKQGKIIIHKEDDYISPKGIPTINESGYFSAIKNTNKMLDILFPNTKNEERHLIKHVPQIQIKSVHKKLKELFPKQFEISSSSRFRNTDCNLMSAFLAEYYSIYTGLAIIGSCNLNNSCSYLQFFVKCDKDRNNEIIQKIKRENPTFLNIQSTVRDTDCNLEEIYKEIFN